MGSPLGRVKVGQGLPYYTPMRVNMKFPDSAFVSVVGNRVMSFSMAFCQTRVGYHLRILSCQAVPLLVLWLERMGSPCCCCCTCWHFWIFGFLRTNSDIHEAKRKPRELITILLLSYKYKSSFLSLLESSQVHIIHNVKGFQLYILGRNREEYIYLNFPKVENSILTFQTAFYIVTKDNAPSKYFYTCLIFIATDLILQLSHKSSTFYCTFQLFHFR